MVITQDYPALGAPVRTAGNLELTPCSRLPKEITMNMILKHLCQAVAVASVMAAPSVSQADTLKALSAQWWQWALEPSGSCRT